MGNLCCYGEVIFSGRNQGTIVIFPSKYAPESENASFFYVLFCSSGVRLSSPSFCDSDSPGYGACYHHGRLVRNRPIRPN